MKKEDKNAIIVALQEQLGEYSHFYITDIEGLNAYQIHPTHKAFGAFITPLRESRACIDYEF